jgi:pilus assembly protein CpaF
MNTGHDGSLTTVHANSPRDAISRLETLSLISDVPLPLKVVRAQIASAVDLIVQQTRLRDGSRKVTGVSEVCGMEGQTVVMSDLFTFEEQQASENGKVHGVLKPTGLRPMFGKRLVQAGYDLSAQVFGVGDATITHRTRRR